MAVHGACSAIQALRRHVEDRVRLVSMMRAVNRRAKRRPILERKMARAQLAVLFGEAFVRVMTAGGGGAKIIAPHDPRKSCLSPVVARHAVGVPTMSRMSMHVRRLSHQPFEGDAIGFRCGSIRGLPVTA